MAIYLFALLLGVVAGLRTMTAPAILSWAAYFAWIDFGGTWAAFFEDGWTRWVFTLLALGELVTDQLPTTPSRKVPIQLAGRIMMGAFVGAAIGAPVDATVGGLFAGAVGAVVGTLGGHAFRARLASAFGYDRPAAFVEDAVAIGSALLIVMVIP